MAKQMLIDATRVKKNGKSPLGPVCRCQLCLSHP